MDDRLVTAHRGRALNPDHPFIRGTAQNPDVYFQMREAANLFYQRVPDVVDAAMARFEREPAAATASSRTPVGQMPSGVIVLMGSGAGAAREAVDGLVTRGERVGLVHIRLFRPFSPAHLLAALPPSVRAIAVLDRTKEPGAIGEPLYQDIVTALAERAPCGQLPTPALPRVIGGRYGLSSKEFTPAMAKAVFDELSAAAPRNHFTVGITDDVSHTSPTVDPSFTTESSVCSELCSSGWAPTARWAPTRTPSRSSARTRTSTCRCTSCTTRRNPGRGPSRTCGLGLNRFIPCTSSGRRNSLAAISSSSSRARCAGHGRTRRDAAHQQPVQLA